MCFLSLCRTIEDALEVKIIVNVEGERQDLATILLREGYVQAEPMRFTASSSASGSRGPKYRPG